MAVTSEDVVRALQRKASTARAKSSLWFFKTGPGQYGEGDQFIGVAVPEQRKVARAFRELPLTEVKKLLRSTVHEHRLTALFILVFQFQQGDPAAQKKVFDFFMAHSAYVNNWDLVDSSAPYIAGVYLLHRPRAPLRQFARSGELWKERIAIVATAAFIREGDFTDTLRFAKLFLAHEHDLIHKAVGWMLREVGKKDTAVLREFLDEHATAMPRTMLRYAIEHFSASDRKKYMKR